MQINDLNMCISSIIRLVFFTILLYTPIVVSACSCGTMTVIDRIASAEFIATAKITKLEPDPNDGNFHIASIEISELFKGEPIKQIYIRSTLRSSCAFLPKEGTSLLIYADQHRGKLSFGYCSQSRILDEHFPNHPRAQRNSSKKTAIHLKILRQLKSSDAIQYANAPVTVGTPLQIWLENQKPDTLPERCFPDVPYFDSTYADIAMYIVTVDSSLTVSDINPVKKLELIGLDDSSLMMCLNRNLKVHLIRERDKPLTDTKVLYIINAIGDELMTNVFISDLIYTN